MKILGKVFLVIILILLFFPFLFLTSFKFQFLSPNFWIDSFRAGNIYPKLERVISTELNKQAKAGKTSFVEARLWTGVLSSDTLQEIIEKNLTLTLDFASGREKEQKFYIPFEKLPKGLVPADIVKSDNEISPQNLAKILTPQAGQVQVQNQSLAKGGRSALVSWIVSLVILLGILLLLYLIAEPGARLTSAGVGLILSSLLTLAIVGIGALWEKGVVPQMLANEGEPAAQLIGAVAPPIMRSMFALWKNIAFGTLLLGIILLFIKKPLVVAKKTTKKR